MRNPQVRLIPIFSSKVVLKQGDCDENDSDISEGALEVCDLNDLDENCNGLADDDDDSVQGPLHITGILIMMVLVMKI